MLWNEEGILTCGPETTKKIDELHKNENLHGKTIISKVKTDNTLKKIYSSLQ